MFALAAGAVTFIRNHFYLLAHLYDPILDQEPAGGRVFRECSRKFTRGELPNIRRHFLVPAVIMPLGVIIGTVGLELDARGWAALGDGNTSMAHALFNSPYVYSHHWFQRDVWPYTDGVFIVDGAEAQ